MDESKYCIYKHTSPNGKSYIGITKNINKRWGENGNGYKKQKKFWNAIKKYGWDNFQHEIIEDNLTLEQACVGEELYIQIYNSIKNGYNIYPGGNTPGETGNKAVIQLSKNYEVLNYFKSITFCSKELGFNSVTAISNWCNDKELHCGYYWRFESDCSDISIDHKKHDGISLYYEHLDFDPRLEGKEKNKQAIMRANTGRNCKKINQYTINGDYIKTWDSISEAASYFGMPNDTTIIRAIKKNYNVYGYRWKYYEGDISNIKPNITKNRTILQYDKEGNFIKEFINSKEAERETGLKAKSITTVCCGKRKTSGGYIWKYGDIQ